MNKITEYFKILNLEKKFPLSEEQVKSAYRKQAKILHPDNKETGSNEKFKELNEAFEYIKTNIDKINKSNLQEKKKSNDNFYIFKATEDFINSYNNTNNDQDKLNLIKGYSNYIANTMKKSEEEDLMEKFRNMTNGKFRF